jgi:threonine/homoserine/homoserine lactone efflux protein
MLGPALLSYVVLMSITPGPNNMMLASSGVRFGLRRTLPHLLGVSSGLGLQLLMTGSLLAWVLKMLEVLQQPLAWAGCGYLLWLSWKIAHAHRPEQRAESRPMGFFAALVFQWFNPKVWLMVINLAVLFMPGSAAPGAAAVQLAAVCALINLPCIAVWALAGERLRQWLSTPGALRAFNYLMASLMALTAMWLLIGELHPAGL